MKRCTYCGKEYPDDLSECAIDGQFLQHVVPTLPARAKPPVSEPQGIGDISRYSFMKPTAAIALTLVVVVASMIISVLIRFPVYLFTVSMSAVWAALDASGLRRQCISDPLFVGEP